MGYFFSRCLKFCIIFNFIIISNLHANTIVGDDNDYIIQVNTDQGSIGEFRVEYITGTGSAVSTLRTHGDYTYINTRGGTSISLDNAGVTVNGGINNTGDGITNAGAISGVTSLSASGSISTTGTISGQNISASNALNVEGMTTTNGISNTGNIATGTLQSSGAATLDSASITNSATVGGTLDVSGAATTNGITNTGVFSSTGSTTLGGVTNINSSGAATTTIGNQDSSVLVLGGTNTIGNANTSLNTLTGATNTLTASGANNFSAGTVNVLVGQTGNTITATTGDNALTATTGANTITAATDNIVNATAQNKIIGGNGNDITAITGNNVMSALGALGENRLMADAATGINSIEAKYNNIGVDTPDSINSIGNTSGRTTVHLQGGNSHVAVVQGSASIKSGAYGLTTTSASNTLGTDAATLHGQLNGVGDEASRANLAGASYFNRLEGDTLINGNTYINGRLVYTSTTAATTSVNSGESVLSSGGATSGHMSIVNKGEAAPHAVVDSNGRISITNGAATQASSAMTLTNGMGNTHGMVITERQTVISGGTQSTSLTLDERGATFGKASNGAPVRVTGVADGKTRWDAVNYGQLNRGVAIAASMATIPQVEPNKTFSLGAGTSYYGDETGIAIGGSLRLSPNTVVKAAASFSPTEFDDAAFSAGFAYSW